MTVYSVFWKIFKKNAAMILMYIGIFVGISAMIVSSMSEQQVGSFESEKVHVAVFDHDKSAVSRALVNFLEKNAKMESVDDAKNAIADALFNRTVEYIAIIPEGFGEAFLQGEEIELEKVEAPGSYSGVYLDNMINSYLDTIKTVHRQMPDMEIGDKIAMADENAEQGVAVSFAQKEKSEGKRRMTSLYNYSCYGIMSSLILGIGILINAFMEYDIRKRCAVSPVKMSAIYKRLSAGTVLLSVFIWAVCEAAAAMLLGKDVLSAQGMLMAANMFVMTLVAMAMGFLMSILIKSPNARSAAMNTVTLVLCFISGIFVPLEYLGKGLRIVAAFTPTYWNIKANEEIGAAVSVTGEIVKHAVQCMGIQLLFVAAFMALGLAVAKKSVLSESP